MGLSDSDIQVLANQTDIMIVDKNQKTMVVIDVVVLSDSKIRKKEVEDIPDLKDELERM